MVILRFHLTTALVSVSTALSRFVFFVIFIFFTSFFPISPLGDNRMLPGTAPCAVEGAGDCADADAVKTIAKAVINTMNRFILKNLQRFD
jgi:hypothetical protein